jgi:hypothetical protein
MWGVHNCIPHDFVAYFMVDWEPKHGFRNKVIAPSTVNSLISHLAMEIDKFGKAHFWDPATSGGKIVVSRKISQATSIVPVRRSLKTTFFRPYLALVSNTIYL